MRTTAKYLFDLDFGGGPEAKPVMPLAEHQANMAATVAGIKTLAEAG